MNLQEANPNHTGQTAPGSTPKTETEFYYENAKKKKEVLLTFINDHNIRGSYKFITEALSLALTSNFYEEVETRNEFQHGYQCLSSILDCCLEFQNAEAYVSLIEGKLKL